MATPRPDADATFETSAEATLFGFPPARASVTIRPRPRAWRVGGAARTLALAVLVAPVLAVVPPHAPWVLGVLAVGGVLARRRWNEHYTVVSVSATCPKCGGEISGKTGRLRTPHPLPCEACHHESTLRLPEAVLQAHAPDDSPG